MRRMHFYNLAELMEESGESEVILLLSSFHCPLNPDVEHFLQHNAINFTKRSIAVTYLVFIYSLSAPLIAQFSKNFANDNNLQISGTELMSLAISQVGYILSLLGGKAVYLECEDNKNLLSFYQSNGFNIFGKRFIKEKSGQESEHGLIQLIKFL